MSPLKYKQIEFTRRITRLLFIATDVLKLNIVLGEVYRPDEMAEIYAKQGKGSLKSVHRKRLALDLTICDENGEPIHDPAKYLPLGIEWERMSSPAFDGKMGFPARPEIKCCWGGRWQKPVDPYHFSFMDDGVS